MGWDGIGTAVGVVAEWFSPKKKVERLKNELNKLEGERNEILRKPATSKSADRIIAINKRIDDICGMLQTAARD